MTALPAGFADHAAALRRLADALVRDPHGADDVVQETMLRALGQPPRAHDNVAGWLTAVARSVIARARRSAVRRAQREAAVARAEALPSAASLVERQQTLRALTDAVLALPAPLQECVLLRFFEGLPPRAIAARLRVPPTVVYGRLQRALAMLRVQLTAGRGDRRWRDGLAAVFGVASGSGLGGALSMGFVKKGWLAAGVLALGALAIWPFTGDDARAPGEEPDAASLAVATLTTPAEPATAASREAVAAPEATALGDADVEPFTLALEVRARSSSDLPDRGQQIWLMPPDHAANIAGQTDDDGKLVVRWRSRVPAMDVWVGAGDEAAWQRVRVQSGTTKVVVLATQKAAPSLVLKTTSAGEVRLSMSGSGSRSVQSFVLRGDSLGAAFGGSGRTMRTEADTMRRFVAPNTARRRDARVRSATIQLDGNMTFEVHATATAAETGGAVARGVVRTHLGQPAAGALVIARAAEHGQPIASATSDENGRFELPGLPKGRLFLRAGGGAHGLAQHEIAAAGDAHTWDPVLDRGHELRGRLVDERGGMLAGWRVVAFADDATKPWIDAAEADAEGRFAIPNVPDRAVRVRVFHPKCLAIPARDLGEVWPDRGEPTHTLRAEQTELAAVRARPTRLAGDPAQDAVAHLFADDLGCGARLARKDAELSVEVPRAVYRLWLGAPSAVPVVQPADLLSGRAHDAGTVPLVDGAALELRVEPPTRWVLYAARDDVRVFVAEAPKQPAANETATPPSNRFTLPPGRYQLEDRSDPRRRRTIDLVAGASVIAELPPPR